ncbi:hypothetical protein Hanom_Chr01g00003381 [Helianthus anomalus]
MRYWLSGWERLGVSCDTGSTPTLPIIVCGIQVKGKYGWRRFVLDRRQRLPIIPLLCLWAGRGWVSSHLGEIRG